LARSRWVALAVLAVLTLSLLPAAAQSSDTSPLSPIPVVQTVSWPPRRVRSGMPPGVPPAARKAEPRLPAADGWPFSEAFPRTMGTWAMRDGALLWTDFIYDDNGAASGPGLGESAGAWPFGTYRYPEENQAGNGADVFRAGVARNPKDDRFTWWRVDWNTLLDKDVPAAAFGIDRDASGGAAAAWGGNVGVTSAGVDDTLVITAAGAFLDGVRVAKTTVDMQAKSFVTRIPTAALRPKGRDKVWLATGLANQAGDAFASLGPEHQHVPGQPNVFNLGFREYRDEPADKNFWFEKTQATTLAAPLADVTRFGLTVDWDRLAGGAVDRPRERRGWSNRWYVSSVELGQGRVKDLQGNVDNEPNYLGRVQPYGVYVPHGYSPKTRAAPLTWLLHSLTINHNQYSATMPDLLRLACEQRNSICATTLGRGPDGYYRGVAELDFWEVWASLNRSYVLHPDRTLVAGYSMGGFGTFDFALDHPDVFAGMAVMASAANEDVPRLENARWLPYYHAHGVLDELVPYTDEALPTVEEMDRLGYRFVFDTYPTKDHVAWSLEDGNDLAGEWMAARDRVRRRNVGDIIYRWYPDTRDRRMGIGATGAWWVRRVRGEGAEARVRATSHALPERRVEPVRSETPLVDSNGSPVVRRRLTWNAGAAAEPKPSMTLRLRNVKSLRLVMSRTGLLRYFRSVISATTDQETALRLADVPSEFVIRLDGERVGRSLVLPKGEHRISLRLPPPPVMPAWDPNCSSEVCPAVAEGGMR
jgi:pimeloyl-ACP methyl ester carboxylesterase